MFRLSSILVLSLSWLVLDQAAAGPPDRASGRMVRDEVAEALRRYRMARSHDSRLEQLEKLAPMRNDPRVKVAFGEALNDPSWGIQLVAVEQFMKVAGMNPAAPSHHVMEIIKMKVYWEEHETEWPQQSKQLPR